MAIALTAIMLAGCGQAGNTDNATNQGGTEEQTTSGEAIRIVNGKIEIDNQLKAFAAEYEAKTGQEVVIESLGGGVDINGALKGYLAAGNMPDVFVFGGDGDYETWKDNMADMSDAEWAKHTEFAYKGENGEVVGFPYAIEGYGITYNADVLEQAGVNPEELINADAWKVAFEKIDGMKEELGLQAVASVAAESGQMFWSTGNHIFGYYLSGGLDRADHTYTDMLQNSTIDQARMEEFADFVKVLFDYADPKVLISGTYDDQLALWAQGKAAFIIQGNWIDPSLPDYDVEFNMGIAPLAFTKADMTGILADSPSWWALNKDSNNIEASKEFLNSLALSEEGQRTLVEESGMISPYDNCEIEPLTPLARALQEYVVAGNTYSWGWTKMPDGMAMNATGPVFELYAKGELDRDGFVRMMEKAIAEY